MAIAKRVKARTEEAPTYTVAPVNVRGALDAFTDDELIDEAKRRIQLKLCKPGAAVTSPAEARNLAVLSFQYQYEVFGVMFFDSQHQLIEVQQMFRGTLAQTSVYPREVVKAALQLNAGAVIFVHNHPSGSSEPSRADEFLTTTLKTALALVDVRVLDHIIVGGVDVTSFAERGLL